MELVVEAAMAAPGDEDVQAHVDVRADAAPVVATAHTQQPIGKDRTASQVDVAGEAATVDEAETADGVAGDAALQRAFIARRMEELPDADY